MTEYRRIYDLMLSLSTELKQAGISHALIGGMALGPRGFPRGTIDVDFLIFEESVQALRGLMRRRGAEPIVEGEEFSSYADSDVRVDFQHARREISRSMLERAQPVAFPDADIPVVQAEDLIGLKVQAYHNNPARLQDRVDIQRLIEANWGKLDLERVHRYFALFQREKDYDDILRIVAASR